MDAERDHRLDHLERRLDVLNASFDRPGAEAGQCMTLTDRDRAVLMLAERPIRLRRLVKQDRADGVGGWTEAIGRDPADRRVGGQQVA